MQFEIGQTVLYEDRGVWGYVGRNLRPARVVGFHGEYILLDIDGFNLPRKPVLPREIVGIIHSAVLEAASSDSSAT